LAYAGHLRDQGFDLFSFDFRNHGNSESEPKYSPLQWVSNHELLDLRGALTYLRTRPDHDPAGFGLFGVSRGGGTALCVGGKDPGVWGVITDGAFSTRLTMLAYIRRWAEIYVSAQTVWARMPTCVFEFLGWTARKRSQIRLNCRFPNVEKATERLSPRPLLMIHGQKDAYIGPKIAEALYDHAGDPKELWLVPKAKHNRCREIEGPVYLERVSSFFLKSAPRVSSVSAPAGLASVLNLEASTVPNPNKSGSGPAQAPSIGNVKIASNLLSH
jgi:pimeloyl-ACP methyl ester carboxylesterase